MEIQHSWRVRLSFNNATIVLILLNVITVLFLLQSFLSSASTRTIESHLPNSVQVKEIEQEAYAEVETVQPTDTRQTAAVDLSKRLKDLRSSNDPGSLKALEEWRKRKDGTRYTKAIGEKCNRNLSSLITRHK